MAENNLDYTETLKLVEKELQVLGSAFSWVFAHYAIKRAFFFSILKCQSFLNVSFRNRSRKTHAVRWGNGITIAYPGLKIVFRSYIRELLRHPFFRDIDEREKKSAYNVGFEFKDFISLYDFLNSWAQTGELANELFNVEERGYYRLRTRIATRVKFRKERGLDRQLTNTFLTEGWSNDNKWGVIKYIGGRKELKKQPGRKNNTWSRLTGGHYLALRPGILFNNKLTDLSAQGLHTKFLFNLIYTRILLKRKVHSVRDAIRAKKVVKQLRIRWLRTTSKRYISPYMYRKYLNMKRRVMRRANRNLLMAKVEAEIRAKLHEQKFLTRFKKALKSAIRKLARFASFGLFPKD